LELWFVRYEFYKICTYSGIFRKNREKRNTCYTQDELATVADRWGPGALTGRKLLTGQKDRGLEKQNMHGQFAKSQIWIWGVISHWRQD
jgi:hypothetical protein